MSPGRPGPAPDTGSWAMGRLRAATGLAFLVGLALTACGGVSQEELDRVSGDLADARAELGALESEKQALSQELSDLERENRELMADVAELRGGAEATEEARDLVRLLNGFFKLGSGQGGPGAGITDLTAMLGDIRDPALKAKAGAAFAAMGTSDEDRIIGEFILLLMDTVEGLLE